jgi:hypothetical protein
MMLQREDEGWNGGGDLSHRVLQLGGRLFQRVREDMRRSRPTSGNVISIMDALRKSVAADRKRPKAR